MTEKQAWPGVYRSKMTGSVVLFTGFGEGYDLASGSKRIGLIACTDDQQWESVTLRAEPAKSVAPEEEPAAQAEPAPMNLFQAIAWLDANRGKELEVVKPGSLSAVRVRMSSIGRLEQCRLESWDAWRPDIDRGTDYSATIPKRQLPTPPAGHGKLA